MGTGWRRAFCTSIRRDPETTTSSSEKEQSPSRSCTVKLGIFSSGRGRGGPSTPRLLSSTPAALDSPRLQCKTTTPTTPISSSSSSSSSKGSPRSPSRFSLRFSRNRCGICAQSVSSGSHQRTAVFTAECSHSFHFPCISTHVRTQGCLICPVCSATWNEVPLLSASVNPPPAAGKQEDKHRDQSSSSSNNGPATKIYNDDESLQLSPTSRGGMLQFNPIPEGEEEEEEEEEQVVDVSDYEEANEHERDVEVSLMPDAVALVSTGRSHQSYVVAIKVKAAPHPPRAAAAGNNKHVASVVPPSLLDPSCRAPIDLVTVLDVSGSMTVAKLQMLKRAMRLVISSLGPGDRLSIVAFSAAAAKRLLPLRRMSPQGQRGARQIVDRLVICHHCSSAPCVGDALRKATKVLEDRRERNPVATIMLLSDGHGHQQQHTSTATTGGSTRSHHPSSATRFTHLEIPIEEQKQRRNHNSMPVPVPVPVVEDAFAKCVNGLVSVVLQDVHLQFAFPSGVIISSVYSYGGGCIGQAVAHGEGGRSVGIGDLYAAEERELLVEIRVPKADHRSMSLSVLCCYRDPVSRDVIQCGERLLAIVMPAPLLSTTISSSSSSTQQQQLQLRNLFVTARAMAESRRLVELSDLDTAIHLLSSARSLLLQRSITSSTHNQKKLVLNLEAELEDLQRQRRQHQQSLSSSQRRRSEQALLGGGGGEPLTPTSAWRAAEQLAKVAIMRKSLNRVSDLHGLENARF